MRFHILIYLFCIFIIPTVKAQSDLYEKAYYITLNGDTVTGFIKQNNDYLLTTEAIFKKTLDSKEKLSLTPTTIEKFVFDKGRSFERLTIVKKKGGDAITTYIFGKILIKGLCCVYNISESKFKEDQKFVIEKDCKTYILQQENHQLELSNGQLDDTRPIIDKRYIGILTVVLGDCDSVKQVLPKLDFSESSFIYIVQKYNRCKNIADYPSICKPIESFKNVSKIITKAIVYYTYVGVIPNKTCNIHTMYELGLCFNSSNPSKSRTFSLTYGLKFTYLKYDITIKYRNPNFILIDKEIVSLPVALNINILNTSTFQFFTTIGAIPRYTVRFRNLNENTDRAINNDYPAISLFDTDPVQTTNISVFAGLGLMYKHVFIQTSFESSIFLKYSFGLYF